MGMGCKLLYLIGVLSSIPSPTAFIYEAEVVIFVGLSYELNKILDAKYIF